jgi:hypothetical protein
MHDVLTTKRDEVSARVTQFHKRQSAVLEEIDEAIRLQPEQSHPAVKFCRWNVRGD